MSETQHGAGVPENDEQAAREGARPSGRIPNYRTENPVPMRNRDSRAGDQAVTTAERLHKLLAERGDSVYRFAGAIDTNPQTVYRWLRADVSPRAELLVAICTTYDVSADWLLGLTPLEASTRRPQLFG